MVSPEVLRRYSIFGDLSDDQLKNIAMISNEKQYKAGEWIIHEDEQADALYIVVSGQVNIYVNIDPTGKKRSDVTTISDGSLLGWAALITDTRTASAEARNEATLVAIDGENLKELLDSDHTLGYKIMRQLACNIYEHLRFTNYQLVSLA